MSPSVFVGLASRVAERAGVDDALVGDILEQHAKSRSLLRLWWQVLGAVVT